MKNYLISSIIVILALTIQACSTMPSFSKQQYAGYHSDPSDSGGGPKSKCGPHCTEISGKTGP